jgi:hypothetical protein
MSKFLKAEDFIKNSANNYDVEVILDFLKGNDITIDKFRWLGKCDCDCQACEGNDFDIWREDVLYDEKNNRFLMMDYKLDDESLETVDFAIYICNECGKWSTYIE